MNTNGTHPHWGWRWRLDHKEVEDGVYSHPVLAKLAQYFITLFFSSSSSSVRSTADRRRKRVQVLAFSCSYQLMLSYSNHSQRVNPRPGLYPLPSPLRIGYPSKAVLEVSWVHFYSSVLSFLLAQARQGKDHIQTVVYLGQGGAWVVF